MPILMLQSLAKHRRPPCSSAHQEALAARVRKRPHHVADALEPEHRVVHVEGNRRHAVVRISRPSRGKRSHRPSLGNPFFENLPVLVLAVVEQHVCIVRSVLLPFGSIDSNLPNRRLETERTAFIRHDRHNQLADRRILQQMPQHAHKAHRRRDGAVVRSASPLAESSPAPGP